MVAPRRLKSEDKETRAQKGWAFDAVCSPSIRRPIGFVPVDIRKFGPNALRAVHRCSIIAYLHGDGSYFIFSMRDIFLTGDLPVMLPLGSLQLGLATEHNLT